MDLTRIGNTGNSRRLEIHNIGSRNFDPTKASNWQYDFRFPLIEPNPGTYRNIYAPSIVKNGDHNWNIYFGGWDGSGTGNDEISIINSQDDFATFGPHVRMIQCGPFTHVNNPSAIKINSSTWRMIYTAYPVEATAPCA
jgi:hypothetical protein